MTRFDNQAVRQWLYGIVTALVPILIAYGVIESADAAIWVALAAAVLGTGTALTHTNTRRDPEYRGQHRAE